MFSTLHTSFKSYEDTKTITLYMIGKLKMKQIKYKNVRHLSIKYPTLFIYFFIFI